MDVVTKNSQRPEPLGRFLANGIEYSFKEGHDRDRDVGVEAKIERTALATANTLALLVSLKLIAPEQALDAAGMGEWEREHLGLKVIPE